MIFRTVLNTIVYTFTSTDKKIGQSHIYSNADMTQTLYVLFTSRNFISRWFVSRLILLPQFKAPLITIIKLVLAYL